MLISVAVPVPNLDLLTYRVPDDAAPPAVGARVVVPLGTRTVTGIVVQCGVSSGGVAGERDIKSIRRVLDTEPFVPPDVVALAQWTAEYYAAGVGDTIPLLLPPMARGGRADAHKTARMAAVTALGLDALEGRARRSTASAAGQDDAEPVGARALTAKQGEALELLAGTPTGIATADLAKRGFASDTLGRLAKQGLVSLRHDRVERDPFGDGQVTGTYLAADRQVTGTDRALTPEQARAVDRLLALVARGPGRRRNHARLVLLPHVGPDALPLGRREGDEERLQATGPQVRRDLVGGGRQQFHHPPEDLGLGGLVKLVEVGPGDQADDPPPVFRG